MARKFVNFIKLFLVLTILIFSLQSWSKANDIRDFEIEGMSIGDTLLNFFDKDMIENENSAGVDFDGRFNLVQLYKSSFKIYDALAFSYIKEENYKIYHIQANIYFRENIEDCYLQKEEIVNELTFFFGENTKKENFKQKYTHDKTGNSKIDATEFYFDNEEKIQVSCNDWGKEMESVGSWDQMKIVVFSKAKLDDMRK